MRDFCDTILIKYLSLVQSMGLYHSLKMMKVIISIVLTLLFSGQFIMPEVCDWLNIEMINDISDLSKETEQDSDDEDPTKELDELFFDHDKALSLNHRHVSNSIEKNNFHYYEEYHKDIPSPPPDRLV